MISVFSMYSIWSKALKLCHLQELFIFPQYRLRRTKNSNCICRSKIVLYGPNLNLNSTNICFLAPGGRNDEKTFCDGKRIRNYNLAYSRTYELF